LPRNDLSVDVGIAASIAFEAADAEDDIVVGDKRGRVGAGHDEARSRLVNPVVPAPNPLQLFWDLDRK